MLQHILPQVQKAASSVAASCSWMFAACTQQAARFQHLLWVLQMQKIPELEKLDLKNITSYGGAMEHGEERAKKHDRAASLYNHVRS